VRLAQADSLQHLGVRLSVLPCNQTEKESIAQLIDTTWQQIVIARVSPDNHETPSACGEQPPSFAVSCVHNELSNA